ncbi:MAG: hypothetical protein FWG64_01880 [Firmicutes bacterium]|nr:hypothetical protein [Bacillota bacterium]
MSEIILARLPDGQATMPTQPTIPAITIEIEQPPLKEELTRLSDGQTTIELRAEMLTIANETDYKTATSFAQELKEMSTKISSFWKPKKDAAHKTHKQICEGEKQMLTPVNNAIATIKRNISNYLQEIEQERQKQAEIARAAMLAESETQLANAITAEQNGDTATANVLISQAQMAETASRNIFIDIEPPKVKGISQTKDWEISTITPAEVPTTINGVEIRPVDEKAVMRLIRASKGTIEIPGITYKKVIKTTIRKGE